MRQVYFQIQDFAHDRIVGLNGSPITEITPGSFAFSNLGDFYIMRNTAGELTLCGDCELMQGVSLDMLDKNDEPYTIKGCDFIGGRPPVTR